MRLPNGLTTSSKNVAVLILSHLRPEDEGIYKCRADFKRSPTKNNRMFLSILRKIILTCFYQLTAPKCLILLPKDTLGCPLFSQISLHFIHYYLSSFSENGTSSPLFHTLLCILICCIYILIEFKTENDSEMRSRNCQKLVRNEQKLRNVSIVNKNEHPNKYT